MLEERSQALKRLDLEYYQIFSTILYFIVTFNPDLRGSRLIWWGTYGIFIFSSFYYLYKNKLIARETNLIYILWGISFILLNYLSMLWALNYGYLIKVIKLLVVRSIALWLISLISIAEKDNFFMLLKIFIAANIMNMLYILYKIDLTALVNVRIGAESLGQGWNANTIGMTMAFAAFCSYFLYMNETGTKKRWLYLTIIMLFATIIILTGSKKALFILILLPLFFYFLRSKNKKKSGLIIFAIIVFIIFLVMNVPALYNIIGERFEALLSYFTGIGKTDSSTRVRMKMINQGFLWFKEKPFLGYGANNYTQLYGDMTGRYTYSHNNFIELLVNLGIIGAAIYYFIYVYIIKKSLRKRNIFSNFAFSSIITILITEIGLVSYYGNHIQLMLCFCLSAVSISKEEENIGDELLDLFRNPKRVLFILANRGLNKWITDEILLKIQFKDKMGKALNLENPQTFNEKVQWLKLYYRSSKYTRLADKYQVRKYIANTIGDEYLIPLIGVWDKFEDIDFSKLPNQFVLKCTHDSGGLVICTDKSKMDYNAVKTRITRSLKRNYYYCFREWVYKDIKPRIICEKYMVDESGTELKDYKFMCFNGEPKIIQVMSGREKGNYFINNFDLKWNEIEIPRKNLKKNPVTPEKPRDLNKMIEISKILSKDLPFVRIDLYDTPSGIYFGEITFFPKSGYMDFVNIKDDYLLGSWISLPETY